MQEMRKDLLNPSLKKLLSAFQLDKNYVSGRGHYLVDDQGVSYLDFISQYGAVPFGYNPEFLWEALEDVRRRSLPSLVQPSLPGEALKLANMLAEITPGDLCYCTFCQSGTEAVEAAIKLARSATGREIVVSTLNSFHGKTLGALSATGKNSYQQPFRAPSPGFDHIPFNDVEALRLLFEEKSGQIAAFIVEPVQGEGGVVVAQPGYLAAVRQLCDEYDVILILDEIQTGLGRTGRLFACEYEDVAPDIMLLSKALGGGLLPLGVCISSPRVWNDEFGMLHSSTFANNNLSSAVGIAVLERLLADGRQLVREAGNKGLYLLDKARQLAEKYPEVIRDVRGLGLMVGMEFHDLRDIGSYDIANMVDQGGFTALLAGYLLNVHQIRLAPFLNDSMTVRLEPALTINFEEINRVISALDEICALIKYQDFARLYRYLIGDCHRPTAITDYRSRCRKIKPSVLQPGEEAGESFAFIIHYPGPEDVRTNNPSFEGFTRQELYRFLQWESQMDDPGLACTMPAIKAKSGKIAKGWLIGVPLGAREMMSLPRKYSVDIIRRAVDQARDMGAGIVGLGALTSVVTAGGRSVQGRGVGITSGNSLTTLMAMEALFLGARQMHIDLEQCRGAVVGATGSIGRACALLLAERVRNITLLGNPERPGSSAMRLNSLAKEMIRLARVRIEAGHTGGLSGWWTDSRQRLEKIPGADSIALIQAMEAESPGLETLQSVAAFLNLPCPVATSLSIESTLPECDLIVAASNSPEYLIMSSHLRPGAVVCDVARPADVFPEVCRERDDVLILEGGLVQYPDDIAFGPNLGYRDGVNLACLSETVLLALEGDYRDHSIGSKLSMETMEYFRCLADRHGFSLAGLRMGDREVSAAEIETIYSNSIRKKASPSCGTRLKAARI